MTRNIVCALVIVLALYVGRAMLDFLTGAYCNVLLEAFK